MSIKELAKKHEQYTIDMRREFHMYPEPSMKEERTARRIKEELEKMGIPCVSMAGTGVLGTIKGKNPGKTIALRADIDALDLIEKNDDISYKSKNEGFNHACGHDTHAAMLLGAAQILNEMKDEINGTVKLMFQPGEEVGQGAKRMIEEGALQGVDEVFGMHINSKYDSGKIAVGAGPRLASADMFKIKIKGKGGHGAAPHQTVDSVVVASAIVMNLQTVVSRETNPMEPLVITVGKITSGSRWNIIADDAVMEGTIRSFSREIRSELPSTLERVAKNIAASYRAEAEVEYTFIVSATINDEIPTQRAAKTIENLFGKDAVVESLKQMGGEDFSEFLNIVPGTFVNLGAAKEEKNSCYPHHHPKFNIDEDVLVNGAMLHAQYALDFLNEK